MKERERERYTKTSSCDVKEIPVKRSDFPAKCMQSIPLVQTQQPEKVLKH